MWIGSAIVSTKKSFLVLIQTLRNTTFWCSSAISLSYSTSCFYINRFYHRLNQEIVPGSTSNALEHVLLVLQCDLPFVFHFVFYTNRFYHRLNQEIVPGSTSEFRKMIFWCSSEIFLCMRLYIFVWIGHAIGSTKKSFLVALQNWIFRSQFY